MNLHPDRSRADSAFGRARLRPALVAGLVLLLGLAWAAPAGAAQLVGGRRQAAIERAFGAARSHRGQVIVSVRASAVQAAWAVVRSVRPEGGGRLSAGSRDPKLQSSYYQLVHGTERAGTPPKPVRAELSRDFRVAVLYAGSGSETIAYTNSTPSVCVGGGQNVDQQQDSVKPMSWSIRYVVDLDHLQSAVRDSQGVMLVPTVSFDSLGSTVSATETMSRTTVDNGCNGTPTSASCTTVYGAGGPDAADALSFLPGAGLEVGVPARSVASGTCGAENYTLGPSLWDSDATLAAAPKLGLLGGPLPRNPYARIPVAWPASSPLAAGELIASPCQGTGTPCTDAMRWNGTIQLQAVGSG